VPKIMTIRSCFSKL